MIDECFHKDASSFSRETVSLRASTSKETTEAILHSGTSTSESMYITTHFAPYSSQSDESTYWIGNHWLKTPLGSHFFLSVFNFVKLDPKMACKVSSP